MSEAVCSGFVIMSHVLGAGLRWSETEWIGGIGSIEGRARAGGAVGIVVDQVDACKWLEVLSRIEWGDQVVGRVAVFMSEDFSVGERCLAWLVLSFGVSSEVVIEGDVLAEDDNHSLIGVWSAGRLRRTEWGRIPLRAASTE